MTFGMLNEDVVDKVVELETPYDVLDLEVTADAVLTVMDPWAALFGVRAGMPVYYVDSLFWFWQWADFDFTELERTSARWRDATSASIRTWARRPVNWHHMVPLAYGWSNRVFVQGIRSMDARLCCFPQGLIRPVGAIVADHVARSDNGRARPLVSISGAISHLTSPNVAQRYCKVIRELLVSEADLFEGATVTGHPELLDVLGDDRWSALPLSMGSMQAAMASASCLLAPAGLTTAMEAASIGLPMVFLPEQHGGHGPNLDLLSGSDPEAYPNLFLRRWFDVVRENPSDAIRALDECYRHLLSSAQDKPFRDMRSQLREAVGELDDTSARAQRAQRQRTSILDIVGNFGGARTVAEEVAA